jgi:voltage-dependent potassium channel beta subunit
MQYRRLGGCGLKVSALSLGAWMTFGSQLDRRAAREMLALAYDQGINFFDNAEVYGHGDAERVMGEALRELALPRDGYCVSSKVLWGSVADPRPTQQGLSRKHVSEACHGALRRLQVDHLDLYLCHRPDPETPIEETVWAMDCLIRQGKVLYWGTSEWPAGLIREAAKIAQRHALHGPSLEQPQYNLLTRDRVELEFAPLYAELGLGTTVFSPLASGLLSGKYEAEFSAASRLGAPDNAWLKRIVLGGEPEAKLSRARRFTELARELGEQPAQLAIAWCLKNPNVSTVILGASRIEQLQANLGALQVAERLDESTAARLEAATD